MKPANVSHCSQNGDTIPLYLQQQGPPSLVPADFPTSFPLCIPRNIRSPESPQSLSYSSPMSCPSCSLFSGHSSLLSQLASLPLQMSVQASLPQGTLKVKFSNYTLLLPQVPVRCRLFRTCHDCNLAFNYGSSGCISLLPAIQTQ